MDYNMYIHMNIVRLYYVYRIVYGYIQACNFYTIYKLEELYPIRHIGVGHNICFSCLLSWYQSRLPDLGLSPPQSFCRRWCFSRAATPGRDGLHF
jgi:hypothetical protein